MTKYLAGRNQDTMAFELYRFDADTMRVIASVSEAALAMKDVDHTVWRTLFYAAANAEHPDAATCAILHPGRFWDADADLSGEIKAAERVKRRLGMPPITP